MTSQGVPAWSTVMRVVTPWLWIRVSVRVVTSVASNQSTWEPGTQSAMGTRHQCLSESLHLEVQREAREAWAEVQKPSAPHMFTAASCWQRQGVIHLLTLASLSRLAAKSNRYLPGADRLACATVKVSTSLVDVHHPDRREEMQYMCNIKSSAGREEKLKGFKRFPSKNKIKKQTQGDLVLELNKRDKRV